MYPGHNIVLIRIDVCMYMNRWENEYKVFEYVDADWLK
jgi:hypothetical protein